MPPFLIARLENDYAEARGIKTVVVLEMLKEFFVHEYSEKVWEPMLPQALRRKIGTVIKTASKRAMFLRKPWAQFATSWGSGIPRSAE